MEKILVFIELKSGAITKLTIEVLGKARELAERYNKRVVGLALGEDYNSEIYGKIICGEIEKLRPQIVLLGSSKIGKELASQISAKFLSCCFQDCVDIDIEDDFLKAKRLVLAGKVFATLKSKCSQFQVATLRQGIFQPKIIEKDAEITHIEVSASFSMIFG